jgi:hypothetical protein
MIEGHYGQAKDDRLRSGQAEKRVALLLAEETKSQMTTALQPMFAETVRRR